MRARLERRSRPPPVDDRRAERELFFWTAHKSLKLIVSVALTVYCVVSLIGGDFPSASELLDVLRELLALGD